MQRRRIALLVLSILVGGIVLGGLLRPSRRARVHLERGRLFLGMRRYESARLEFEQALRLSPPGHLAQLHIGRTYAAEGRIDRALDAWLALRDTPLAADAFEASVRVALEAGRLEEADALCATAVSAGVPEERLAMTRAELAMAHGRVAEALQQYRRAREAGALDGARALRLAEQLEAAGAATEAESVAHLAWEAGFRDVGVALLLGKAAQAAGRWPEALRWFEQAAAVDAASPLARIGLMQTAMAADDWDRAALEAAAAVDSRDAAPFAQLVLGHAAFRHGRLAEAETAFAAAAAALPDDPMASAWLARTRLRLGDVEGGLARLRKAVAQAPTDDALRLELLRVLWEHGRVEEARRFAAGFARAPTTEEERVLLAAARAVPPEDAGPDRPDHLETARLALAAGDLAKARAFALGSLHAAADGIEPLLVLSDVARREGDVRFALGYVDAALRRAPTDRKAILARAQILRDAGQGMLAADELARLEGRRESGDPQLSGLALELWEEGRAPARSVAFMEGRDPHALAAADRVRYARALLWCGYPDRARTVVAGLGTPEAQLVRTRALLARRRDREAVELYRQMSPARSMRDASAVLRFCLGRGAGDDGSEPESGGLRMALTLATQGRADLPLRGDDARGVGWRLALLAAMEDGDWAGANDTLAAAAPWAPRVDATTPMPGDALAYRRALLTDLMAWPGVAARFFEDARVPPVPLWVEPYALVLERMGRTDDALALAKGALSAGPGSPDLWFLRARLEVERHGPAATWSTVQAGIRHNPDSALLLGLAGHLAQRHGETNVALDYYRAAANAGAPPLVLNNLAWLLLGLESHADEAVRWARSAHDAAPYAPVVLDTLARCLTATGKHEEALYYANLGALLQPHDPEVRLLRVALLVETQRIAIARRELEQLLASVDEDFAARPDVRKYVERLSPSLAATG